MFAVCEGKTLQFVVKKTVVVKNFVQITAITCFTFRLNLGNFIAEVTLNRVLTYTHVWLAFCNPISGH